MSTEALIKEQLEESTRVKTWLEGQSRAIGELFSFIKKCVESDGTIYACGNGGSACDAMHFVEECVARYKKERPGIKAAHLMDSATLTCWANDYDYESAFARQVETHMSDKDLLLVFSTSGNSKNILLALEAARTVNAQSVALLGKDGGEAKELADYSFVVNSDSTARIQEAHITVVHCLMEALES